MNKISEMPPIFLVEDNPLDLDLAQKAFKRGNVLNPLRVFRDGALLLEVMESWTEETIPPIFILLDLKLPKVGGLELLGQLKMHPQMKVIPVVILSSSDDAGDIQSAYDSGANSYVVKPVEFEKLVELASQLGLYWSMLNVSPARKP